MLVTNQFRGPGSAIGPVCVCVCTVEDFYAEDKAIAASNFAQNSLFWGTLLPRIPKSDESARA